MLDAISGMLKKSGTSTADTVAAVRARHRRERVRIFDDPYARSLCGGPWRLVLRIPPLQWIVDRALRPLEPVSMDVLMRARYAEEVLERAIEDGVTQYVVIGAGMDSFAFRRPGLMERIDIFEIDHPATQEKKLERIRRAGLTIPPGLHFVPADLEEIATLDALEDSGFDRSRSTFLTLLGVVYYLTADSLAETARSIARNLPPGTLLVIDYLLDEESSKPEELLLRQRMKAFVARLGEPMISEYSLAAMESLMADQGLGVVENFAIPELKGRYEEEAGALPAEIPGIFAFGTFGVAASK